MIVEYASRFAIASGTRPQRLRGLPASVSRHVHSAAFHSTTVAASMASIGVAAVGSASMSTNVAAVATVDSENMAAVRRAVHRRGPTPLAVCS